MPLEFLKPQPERTFRKLEEDLKHVNPKRDLSPFKAMTPRRLAEELKKLENVRQDMIHKHTYGEWLSSPKFAEMRMLQEALEMLHEYKTVKEETEELIPGFAYYRGVKQFGSSLTGQRCYYSEGANPVWGKFHENVAVAKAKTVLAYGDPSDFAAIFIEMADGRPEALGDPSLEHLTESSTASLGEIEGYCDQRWSGPWPWELTAPYKLRTMIEDHTAMRQDIIEQFHAQIRTLLREFQSEEMDRYAVISQMQEAADKIEKMIQELGRMLGEGLMQLKATATVSLGDEAASMAGDNLTEPLNQAADALTQLLASITKTMESLETGQMGMGGDEMGMGMGDEMGAGGMPGDMGDEMGDEMGAPGGEMAIGGDEEDLAGDMSDVDLGGGDEAERLKKEM